MKMNRSQLKVFAMKLNWKNSDFPPSLLWLEEESEKHRRTIDSFRSFSLTTDRKKIVKISMPDVVMRINDTVWIIDEKG